MSQLEGTLTSNKYKIKFIPHHKRVIFFKGKKLFTNKHKNFRNKLILNLLSQVFNKHKCILKSKLLNFHGVETPKYFFRNNLIYNKIHILVSRGLT